MISYETRLGSIGFTENFLSKLIGHAVTSCFGVVGMMPSSRRQRLTGLVSRKEPALDKGIKVTGTADEINVEIHIMVTFGMSIPAIAASITEKIRYVVKEATGIDVNKVNVKVDGIKE